MREKMLKERAGVSPAIATILLILIAIAAGIIIYAYTVGYLGTTPGGTGAGEIALQAADLTDNTTDNVVVYVKNVGGTDLNATDIYVELYGGGPLEHVGLDPSDPGDCDPAGCVMEPGETLEINVDLTTTGAVVDARDSSVRVVCADGTAASQTFRAHD